MAEIGISKKFISITRMCVRIRVRIGVMLSDPFEVNSWLKQQDAISPVLFNIALDKAIRTAKISVKLFSRYGPRLLLAFADDIDVVGNTVLTVNDLFSMVETQAAQMGLRINENKTKYMLTSRTGRGDRVGQNVTMKEYNFERVTIFKYLEATITQDNNLTEEIKVRIQSGIQSFMYASKTWILTKDNERFCARFLDHRETQ